MKYLKTAVLTILAAATLFLLAELGLLAKEARAAIQSASGEVSRTNLLLQNALIVATNAGRDIHAIETDTQRTEAEMAGLLNQTRHSMLTQAQVKSVVDRANILLESTNAAVTNVGIVANGLQRLAPTIEQAISEVAEDVHNTMGTSQGLIAAATNDLDDPSITRTLDNVAHTSANVEATSTDIKDFVHRETAPVRGTWNVIKAFLFEIAGPAASVASAVK